MIEQYKFGSKNYVVEATKKSQIYLHHTAGGPSAESVYKWWESNPERIATHFVIGAGGTILQGFDLKHWAFHLGLKQSTFNSMGVKYRSLDKISIGIEICNWGQLTYKNGQYYNYVGRVVPTSEVTELKNPFKGFSFYHKYTDAQINAVRQLLLHLNKETGIPINYNESIMWGINFPALNGDLGVYTHNSVRRDKNDVYPCPRLIEMLKSL